MPSSWSARMTRTAISPRFATRTRSNTRRVYGPRRGRPRVRGVGDLLDTDKLRGWLDYSPLPTPRLVAGANAKRSSRPNEHAGMAQPPPRAQNNQSPRMEELDGFAVERSREAATSI